MLPSKILVFLYGVVMCVGIVANQTGSIAPCVMISEQRFFRFASSICMCVLGVSKPVFVINIVS